MAAQLEALILDPVYTGKAMAGLVDLVRTGLLHDAKDVIFLHTGGSPAMFAYCDALTVGAGAP
jgi:1-aminocyclopropane-1-carboxylate deaminase/D-cysteine desulfhydrase-like pyridoxal-dependent ACC family enzyme